MKFDDVVAKVRALDDGTGDVWIRDGEVDIEFIAIAVIRAAGFVVQEDSREIVKTREWEPPGGLARGKRTYRNGRGVRK